MCMLETSFCCEILCLILSNGEGSVPAVRGRVVLAAGVHCLGSTSHNKTCHFAVAVDTGRSGSINGKSPAQSVGAPLEDLSPILHFL
jgi:hypothetical protein